MPVVRTGKQPKKTRVSLDASLFDLALLQDEIAIENALCVLEGHLRNPTVDQESLLNDLLNEKNLFEFVFAGELSSIALSPDLPTLWRLKE